MFETEKRGIPTVSWTANRFEKDAQASARAFGLPIIALALIPTPATNESDDSISKMAENAINQVIDGLIKPALPKVGEITAPPSEILKFQGEDTLEAIAVMNKFFLEKGWSDGFPIMPPTRQAVERMLSGTSLNANKSICLLEPAFGMATVEKVAINAVMAGCQPEHLPVVITALKCLADPAMLVRNFAMSTAPHAPLVLINGPIAKKLGINAKSCALGPGSISYANTVIGRSIRLIMMNIGHSYPGVGDMDTIGSPTKYSMCLAENEDENPWEPFHVERGYDRDTSTVTIHFNYGLCDMADAWSTAPEGLVERFAGTATNLGHMGIGQWLIGHRNDQRYNVDVKEHDFILMCPDHAKVFNEAKWSKNQVRQAIHEHALAPGRLLWRDIKLVQAAHPDFADLEKDPERMLPVLEDPECYHIAVVGADVGRSLFCWGAGDAVTKAIEEV
jgi:hypothetical protein